MGTKKQHCSALNIQLEHHFRGKSSTIKASFLKSILLRLDNKNVLYLLTKTAKKNNYTTYILFSGMMLPRSCDPVQNVASQRSWWKCDDSLINYCFPNSVPIATLIIPVCCRLAKWDVPLALKKSWALFPLLGLLVSHIANRSWHKNLVCCEKRRQGHCNPKRWSVPLIAAHEAVRVICKGIPGPAYSQLGIESDS